MFLRHHEQRVFAKDEGGNVAAIFALCLLPMIGMIGLAVDTSRTIAARTSLQGAADAAALAATTEAMAILQSSNNDTASAQYAGTFAGQQVFSANVSKTARVIGKTPTPVVTVSPGSANITAFVSFDTTVPTIFGKIFGTKPDAHRRYGLFFVKHTEISKYSCRS